jgi:hypothetical protein
MTLRALVLWIWLVGAACAETVTVATVTSPGNVVTATVTLNGEGRAGYTVSRSGVPVIAESRLGFILADAPKLERNFKAAGSATRSVDETWLRAQSLQRAASPAGGKGLSRAPSRHRVSGV